MTELVDFGQDHCGVILTCSPGNDETKIGNREKNRESVPPTNSQWKLIVVSGYVVLVPLAMFAFSTQQFIFPKTLLLWGSATVLVVLAVLKLASAVWTARSIRLTGGLTQYRCDAICVGVIALLGSAVVSTLFSVSPVTSLIGDPDSWAGLVSIGSLVVLFFATRSVGRSALARRVLVWAVVVGSALVASYGLIQFFGLDPIGWSRQATLADWVRISSTIGHPNQLSAYLSMSTPLVLYLLYHSVCGHRRAQAVCLTVVLFVMTAVVMFSFSRAGWAAQFLAVLATAAGWYRTGSRRAARNLVLACAVLAVVTAAVSFAYDSGGSVRARVQQRLADVQHVSQNPRAHLWSAAVMMVAQRPLLGFGVDSFKIVFPRVQPVGYWQVEWGRYPTRSHNEMLYVASTQGLVGCIAALVLAAGIFAKLRRAMPGRAIGDATESNETDTKLAVALASGIGAYLIHALFGFSMVSIASLLALQLGLLCALPVRNSGNVAGDSFSRRSALAGVAIAGVLGTACIVGNGLFAEGERDFTRLAVVGIVSLSVLGVLVRCAARPFCAEDVVRAPVANSGEIRLGGRAITFLVYGIVMCGAFFLMTARPFVADVYCYVGSQLLDSGRARAAIDVLDASLTYARSRSDCRNLKSAAQASAAKRAASPEERLAYFDEALDTLETAIREVPENPFHRAELARVLSARSKVPGAETTAHEIRRAFDDALSRAPNDVTLRVEAGNSALDGADPLRAVAEASTALEHFPKFGPAMLLLARVSMVARQWHIAETELRDAVASRWPRNTSVASAWSALADVHLHQGHIEQALDLAARAVRLEPNRLESVIVLARTHELMFDLHERNGTEAVEHRAEAVKAYRHVLEIMPDNAEALRALERFL